MRTRLRISVARTALASLLALHAGICIAENAGDLAREVLALDQQILAAELVQANPPQSRLSVFVGARAEDYRLRRASLKLDQEPTLNYEYSQPEWQALAAGGLHPAMALSLAPGEHRLQIEIVAREVSATAVAPRLVLRLDQQIKVSGPETAIELTLTQASFGRERIEVRDWTHPGEPGDLRTAPEQRAAEFWLGSGQPVLAAQTLLRAQVRNPAAGLQGADLLGRSLARIGADLTHRYDPAVDRYNAAVAGLAPGNVQAEAALAALGKEDVEDEAALSLRDRANLVLGYHYLRQGNSEAALETLARVRSPGPHGNAAMLAFGWAFLVTPESRPEAQAGGIAQPAFIAALASSAARHAPGRTERLQSALVPWTELVGRDPLDPAAQEGALALAWALDQLGTGQQAHIYYQRAATQLELARVELDAAMEQVRSGRAAQLIAEGMADTRTGWRSWLSDLPYREETGYLKYLLEDPRFVEGLDPYRVAHRLRAEVESCATRLEALPAAGTDALGSSLDALRSRVARHEADARQALETVALDGLRRQKQRTERYLVEARLAMARHYDRAPEIDLTERKRGAGAAS